MFDVICVGNATIDVFVYLHAEVKSGNLLLPVGSKREVESIFYSTGGGATNTAVGFRRLGLRTAVLAAVGGDPAGKIIVNELRREKINTKLVAQLPGFKTAYSAILTGFGDDRIILTYGGATTHLGEEKRLHFGLLGRTRWMHVSSFHSHPELLRKMLRFAKEHGIGVSFNPGMSEIKMGLRWLHPLLENVSVLLLNRGEAAFLTGSKDVKKQLAKLQGIVPTVVVTDGKKGAHAFDGKCYYFKPTFKVKVVDTTGAGDAFHCGFVGALLKGASVEHAMGSGTANAHSVIMHLGAKNKLLSWHGIQEFLQKHGTVKTAAAKSKIA